MQYAGAKASTLLFTVLFIFEKFFSTASVYTDCVEKKTRTTSENWKTMS